MIGVESGLSIDEVKDAVATTVIVSLSSKMDAMSSEITGRGAGVGLPAVLVVSAGGLDVALDVGLVSFLSLVDRMINKPFVNTGYTGQGGGWSVRRRTLLSPI